MTTTRRDVILGALGSLTAALAAAMPSRPAPLDVTYYFLPG